MKLSTQKLINRADLAQVTDLNALRQLVIAQGDQLAKQIELLEQRDQTIQLRDRLIERGAEVHNSEYQNPKNKKAGSFFAYRPFWSFLLAEVVEARAIKRTCKPLNLNDNHRS